LRSWERDVAALRTGDGRALPPLLRAELDRLRRRIVLVLELIRELEDNRIRAMEEAEVADRMIGKITALQRIRGIGENFAAVPALEVFYRSFDNRRQLATMSGSPRCSTKAAAWIATEASAGRPTACTHHDDPARLALAGLSARQRSSHLVP
jgi:transposase